MTRRPARDEEHREQVAVVAWARYAAARVPCLGLLFAIPNGGRRDKATAGRLKAEGVRAGMPDLCLPVPRGGACALWIEMKTETGRLSEAQRETADALRAEGARVEVCRSAAEAIGVLEAYAGA